LAAATSIQIIGIIAISLFGSVAVAEGWLCTEAASQRSGDVIRSCGVGYGSDENAARRDAFDNARIEFGALCDTSDDCRGREVSVTPERTSCEPTADGGYKCYRLLVFTLGSGKSDREPFLPLASEPLAAPPSPRRVERLLPRAPVAEPEEPAPEPAAPAEVALPERRVERRLAVVPFRPAAGAKIRVGMSKAEVLERFGRPDVVREGAHDVAVFYRGRTFCHGDACMFRFERDTGRVIVYRDFRTEFTEALN
jgi:hypothetical protein